MCSSATLILASSSPRRRELMAQAGYAFTVASPVLDEPATTAGLSPSQQAEALAYFKARSVHDRWPDAWVLGADTVVAAGGRIMGKAADAVEARAMLSSLSGTRHACITGVALLGPGGRRRIASQTTWVTMRALTSEEIQAYVDSGEWIGKAGAYAIQETADRFVQTLEGSFSNVVGLPMELLARMIAQLQSPPPVGSGR
jgi:septum formation protein